MYSCCNIEGKNTKTKVIFFSVIVIAVGAASYAAFTAANNGSALALSGILGFAACPAMCAIMGGGMWIVSRFANRKSQKINSEKENIEQSCCPRHSNEHRRKNLENST